MTSTEQMQIGVIHPDELYTLEAIKRRLGIKDATLRSARRAGLRVFYVHRQAYIHGSDWIAYVRNSMQMSNADQQAAQ